MGFYTVGSPQMGYFAEPTEVYGYDDGGYGYYAEQPEMVGWGEPDVYGAIEPGYDQYEPVGYLAEDDPLGYYGYYGQEYPPYQVGYPVGYVAEDYPPLGWYAEGPEMMGYDEYEPLSEPYPEMGYYGGPDLGAYVREQEPTFNAGCPMPTNVQGYGATEPLEGYVRPDTVNATCTGFTPSPAADASIPETFKPLW